MTDAKERIDALVHKNDVVLFMKGTPLFPQCGFSITPTTTRPWSTSTSGSRANWISCSLEGRIFMAIQRTASRRAR